ncbi:YbjP/YqhG family protein [Paraburkholderia sp. D15]|uniref:DUF3828 domain-containing protein n=1 Tax=Paraburkholderia sp. D15 TaxID=2880218 RepID=UPI0024784081|nr:DUF3828 domain-containing protein [Paraburkholderia sp. D15]WGS51700.1 YbjP/YqhG family protein [Paraburkholderia sp. D15]WKF55906.1 hypothetical protein HUO10_000350 [Paraburkholderia busanensis]
MKKLTTLAVAVLLIASAVVFSRSALADASTPAETTKAFYSWYFKVQSEARFPLLDKNIYTYVAKSTVDKLRDDYRHNRLPGDSDYFTKVQDDDKDWANNIATHPTVMLGDVAVVAVTFGSTDRISVVVFLGKRANAWRITKVDDTLGLQ